MMNDEFGKTSGLMSAYMFEMFFRGQRHQRRKHACIC
jgi:hypothetical protein